MADSFFAMLALAILATTVYKIIELKHNARASGSRSSEQADRDDRARALEERVKVLEKIVTENYQSSALSAEIDQLREQANER